MPLLMASPHTLVEGVIISSIKHLRDEYVAHQTNGGCPFDPAASTLFESREPVATS